MYNFFKKLQLKLKINLLLQNTILLQYYKTCIQNRASISKCHSTKYLIKKCLNKNVKNFKIKIFIYLPKLPEQR